MTMTTDIVKLNNWLSYMYIFNCIVDFQDNGGHFLEVDLQQYYNKNSRLRLLETILSFPPQIHVFFKKGGTLPF